ncbi:hypothetical protein TNCV_2126421 [Trichonephila clavipes]|nr:hypothetical protein TNCV_2126421 [Trichonephila clavipes]
MLPCYSRWWNPVFPLKFWAPGRDKLAIHQMNQRRNYAVLCSKLPLRSGLETESASTENSTIASSFISNVLANQACTSEVLLQTLVVVLQNGNHKSLERALIDTGSQKSYILKSTAEKLGFKYEGEEEFVHSLIGGSKTKRVKEIRNLSDVSSWEHSPSEKNFADISSRGCSAQQLIYLRWWKGPSWLSEKPVQCPRSKQVPDEEAINLE